MKATIQRRTLQAVARDQNESAFAVILSELVSRVPGAWAAALVDREGETVDYSGRGVPFDLRLAAAHWRLIFGALREQPSLETARHLGVRTRRATYVVHALPEGYALVVMLSPRTGPLGWRRAVDCCAWALREEAGWDGGARPHWLPVNIQSDAKRRPLALLGTPGGPRSVEVLGSIAPGGLAARERGWRVRLDSGLELTLIREPGGAWYAEGQTSDPAGAAPAETAPGATIASARSTPPKSR